MSVNMLNLVSEDTSADLMNTAGYSAVTESIVVSNRRLALRLAETSADREAARELINRRYAWRGYGSDHKIPDQDNYSTFIALVDDEIVGTITLGVDSRNLLAIDNLFREEVDAFRQAPGAQVCELIKFAFEADVPDQENLAVLFHTVFLYGIRNYNCTDLFIEVNPRHIRFYRNMLGFTPIGDIKINPGVEAPAQLMWLNVSEIHERIILSRVPNNNSRSRSLYPLFLTRHEEEAVNSRLARQNEVEQSRGINLVERILPAPTERRLAA